MANAGNRRRILNNEEKLELGRMYVHMADSSEIQSDYTGAANLYRMSEMIFSELMEQGNMEAKGEYLHTMFRLAVLPQTSVEQKIDYLEKAGKLAAELERETDDIEFEIAGDSIRSELEMTYLELNARVVSQRMK